jgi:hypothetical protein
MTKLNHVIRAALSTLTVAGCLAGEPSSDPAQAPPPGSQDISAGLTANGAPNAAALTAELLFYNSSAAAQGVHAFAQFASDGTFVNQSSGLGFSIGWTHVVEGGDHHILFYNSNTGVLDVHRLSHSGVFSAAMPDSTCSGWTNITITPHDIVLFYNGLSLCRGRFNYGVARLRSDNSIAWLSVGNLPSGWTSVTAAANDEVVFYAAATGAAEARRLDLLGTLGTAVPINVFSPGWTHVVASFSNLLLFYNTNTGALATGRIDSNGVYTNTDARLVSSGWTSVAAGSQNGALLFYNGNSPAAAMAISRLDTAGHYTDVQRLDGLLSTGWTHIVAE